MNNNDILRRVRYALDLSNQALTEIFKHSGKEFRPTEFLALLKKETEPGFVECTNQVLAEFLDGLIALRRGTQAAPDGSPTSAGRQMGNNDILKKLRIALELKEGDMLEVFRQAGFPVTKSELTALFRTKGHANYKECGDQLLRNFLKGITLKLRGDTREPGAGKGTQLP